MLAVNTLISTVIIAVLLTRKWRHGERKRLTTSLLVRMGVTWSRPGAPESGPQAPKPVHVPHSVPLQGLREAGKGEGSGSGRTRLFRMPLLTQPLPQ